MRTNSLKTLSQLLVLVILLAAGAHTGAPLRATAQGDTFGTLTHTIPVPALVLNTIVADWDSDGNNELIALVGRGDPTAPNGYLAAYEFDGTEYVEEFRLDSPTRWPRNVDVGDVNGDGRNDVVLGTGDSDAGGYVFVISQGDIVWASEWIGSIRFPTQLCVGDTDEDGVDEIGLAVTWYDRYLTLYDHVGGNDFSQVFRRHQGDGHSCDVGDIDGDGRNELVYGTGSWSGRVTAFEHDGAGYTQLWDVNVFYPHRAYVELGDTDGDGIDEIVVTSGEGSDPQTAVLEGSSLIWMGGPYGDTPGTRRAPTVGSWFNNGRNQIAFVAAHGTDYVVHLVEYDGATYQDVGSVDRDNSIRTLIRPFIGDADNDGLNELVVPELMGDDTSRISIYAAQTPQVPAGRDVLSARVYVDAQCDGRYTLGRDVPMADVPVTLSFPNGASVTQRTAQHGWAYASGFDAGEGVDVRVSLPEQYAGRPLLRCHDSPSNIRLTAADFSFGYKLVQFRVGIDSDG